MLTPCYILRGNIPGLLHVFDIFCNSPGVSTVVEIVLQKVRIFTMVFLDGRLLI